MKTALWCCAILIGGLGVAEAQAPFAPHRNIADHVITMQMYGSVLGRDKPGSGTRIVTFGAGWFRVASSFPTPGSTTYYDHPTTVSVTLLRQASGEYDNLTIARGLDSERSVGMDYESYRTGERQVHLGEPCSVWDVMRSRSADPHTQVRKYSCVTDDGLELWHRLVGSGGVIASAEATKIERRPVAASEVQPPRDLLDLNAWPAISPGNPASGPTPSDFESEMRIIEVSPGRNGTTQRTTRRHHPWVFVEDRLADGGSILSVENRQTRLRIQFESKPGNEYQKLSFARFASDEPTRLADSTGDNARQPTFRFEARQQTLQEDLQKRAEELREQLQKQGDRARYSRPPPAFTFGPPPRRPINPTPFEPGLKETILSESCTWFDMTPGVMDAGYSQCRTSDDIALKEDHWFRGGRQVLEAVRLERRAVAMDEVLPPADVLNREAWGLPK